MDRKIGIPDADAVEQQGGSVHYLDSGKIIQGGIARMLQLQVTDTDMITADQKDLMLVFAIQHTVAFSDQGQGPGDRNGAFFV